MICNLTQGLDNYLSYPFEKKKVMIKKRFTKIIQGHVPLVAILIFTGCTSNDTTEEKFGDSVRHTIALQTANPRSQGIGMDGPKAALALQKYQRDVGDPKKIDQQEIAPVSVGTQ